MTTSVRKAQRQEGGFTLIELMVVISIITVMATMALPSFRDRVIRAQVEEAFALGKVAMASVEEHYKVRGTFPGDNSRAGLPAAEKMIGNYVTRVSVEDGVVTVILGNRINANAEGKSVVIRPAIVEGEPKVPIAWVYGHATVPKGMTVMGVNSGTLPPRHLPVYARY